MFSKVILLYAKADIQSAIARNCIEADVIDRPLTLDARADVHLVARGRKLDASIALDDTIEPN